MSTIHASNYGDGTGSVPASAVLEGTAKAWANVNMATPAIVDDYNCSSLTDSATGKQYVSLTNAFTGVSAMRFNGSTRNSSTAAVPSVIMADLSSGNFTASQLAFHTANVSGGTTAFTDLSYVGPASEGTLA